MAKKLQLRELRAGTVINLTSKSQEKALSRALVRVCKRLMETFPGLQLSHRSSWLLKDVTARLKRDFPDVEFHYCHETSAMRPDGGILSLVGSSQTEYPILIAEKKNQGTNDLRIAEGKKKQAKGNAIERLGKNVIGLRAALLKETIFPFVCFGDGCDFASESSILDRIVTIAMFGKLNVEHLHNQGAGGVFNRGSFYFRPEEWTEEEMYSTCISIAERSVLYYMSKYGREECIPQGDKSGPAEGSLTLRKVKK